MREPSIHVSEANLLKVVEEIIDPRDARKMGLDLEYLVNQILIRGRKYSLSRRKILVSNKKQQKQAENVVKSELQYNIIMAKIIYLLRKQKRHKGIEMIKASNKRDWTILKIITAHAIEFKEEYFEDDTYEEAFKTYISLGMERMKTFSLNKFPSMSASIIEGYGAMLKLKADKNTDYTERAYKKYNHHVLQNIGTIIAHYDKIPDKYRYFMEVAQACKELKITPEIYIDAQFAGLKWANGIPDPSQLVGDNANKRLQTYLFENQVQLRDVNKESNKENVNKLKSILKNKK